MKRGALAVVLAMLVAGCASQPSLTTMDTRAENVDHRRLQASVGTTGSAQVGTYQLLSLIHI